jgi:hypothetical protein
MTKKVPISMQQLIEAISLVKNAEHDWPKGMSNPFVRECVQKAEADLKELMYEVGVEMKGKKSAESSKKAGQTKE